MMTEKEFREVWNPLYEFCVKNHYKFDCTFTYDPTWPN